MGLFGQGETASSHRVCQHCKRPLKQRNIPKCDVFTTTRMLVTCEYCDAPENRVQRGAGPGGDDD